ncbi:MAG: UTP--glucose-1-phosphate uridylyltransferase [Candidatus Cloacimonetes bacterium HGW-Cloacimonetes-1]|jgi:UTP--glucose-1-phosphate uridylyltransferase|nr:MAG: UTP--glucose-1-phosphate uridylyltransferase [Candidatus Cloacimonetes bacterium HGW-Cloacimonetes-1]
MHEAYLSLLKSENIPDNVIRTFEAYYQMLVSGDTGKITNEMISPPTIGNLVEYNTIANYRTQDPLNQIVVIKLNGGLGTSMGLSKAKSLLPVKGNMTFLDIITRQILIQRAQSAANVQLLFMNSYSTEADTINYLSKYPDLAKQEIPISFLQNKFPRIRQDNLQPFESPDRSAIWNPPGHGDIFTAITANGLLEQLIDSGITYAFVSNSDNLGATLDSAIPAYMKDNQVPFLMEVCHRTESDRKGGHLGQDAQGKLLLREVAQCPDSEIASFQNIDFYKYFNTNNLWIDLHALKAELVANDGIILLPLIINPKEVEGTPVYQLETAMGAAINLFDNAKALVVPRERFAPVKKTSDLLALWSDAYELNDQYQIVLKRGLVNSPVISLDENFYKDIRQMQDRFHEGIPSLYACTSLDISGDVSFGEDVTLSGTVKISTDAPVKIRNRSITGELNL